MSISGPCAWLSSLPPPVTSHLSGIQSNWPTASWSSEQAPSRPKVTTPSKSIGGWEKDGEPSKPSPAAMHPAVIKAENALSAANNRAGTSTPIRHPGAEVPKGDARLQHPEAAGSSSQTGPEALKQGVSHISAQEATPTIRRPSKDELADAFNDGDAMDSSDDGAGSPGEKRHSSDSKLEKKKMKRFRLTHNQTRFLMSEFTRQAHPDAAHRERLSREIPGLTPRQVQVWFQNRRAKLKRLTSNDRERMLKSRALPDDFDTTQVLRTPFEGKPPSDGPVLMTDGLQRLNDDDYVISPLSSASTTGHGFSSAGPDRSIDAYPSASLLASRAPGSLTDLHRNNRGTFPYPRSSSFSEASLSAGLHFPGRYRQDSLGYPGMPYARRPVDYALHRPANGMVVGYDQQRQLEGSVSPTGQPEQSMPYSVDSQNQPVHSYQSPLTMPAPKGYSGMEIGSQMQSQGRQIPSIQSIPVSEATDYRPYSYEHHPYSMNAAMPYSHANTSSMSLPASFPSDSTSVTASSSSTDPMRAKYSAQTFDYANYL